VALASHGADAPTFGAAVFDEFNAWDGITGATPEEERRKSIARGQSLFNGTAPDGRGTFTAGNVAGFNDFPGLPNPLPGVTCATCHNFAHAGADFLPASQRDIGIGGQGVLIGGPAPASDLPIFKLECPAGSFLWDANLTTVTTNDPGKALITGKCRDIGSKTVPGLRALAAHEPYFSDGSAATLVDVVNVYNNRFSIGLTDQEKQDLVNFLNAL
jgi:cytochrome c peroxidase